MPKADLGEKRVCPECGSKFYDLAKRPAVCPMCQHSYDPEAVEAPAPLPTEPLAPEEGETQEGVKVDEEDMDEAEDEAKELELDGDDAAIIAGSSDGDDEGHAPDFTEFSPDEDEDEDAALVTDEEDTLPPGVADDDDEEEIEI